MNSAISTWRNQPHWFHPSALSTVISAIQLIIARPGLRVRMRDRIEDHSVPVGAEADERGARADRLGPGCPTPHDGPAPMDRRLVGMHLRPDRGVDAVGADQQPAVRLRTRPVRMIDEGGHAAVGRLAVAADAAAQADGVRAKPFNDLTVKQHVQAAAVYGVLRPLVPGLQAARLGIDVVAVQPDQSPFAGRHANLVELVLANAEIVELAHGVGLQIDADAQRPHLPHGLVDHAGHADLVEGQCGRQSADTAAGDDHRVFCHAWLCRVNACIS